MDSVSWLMQWYLSRCDGDWEHTYGIDIGNLDNPGWSLEIDLSETDLDGRQFAKIEHGPIASDLDEWRRTGSWYVAEVKESRFQGTCGPLDLPALINVFRQWAEA